MSFKFLAWAQSHKTGSSAGKAVLLAVCAIINDDGEGFPSQQRIADDSELSIRTVKREMDKLEAAGYLSRQRRYRADGYRTSDLICLSQTPQILGAIMSGDTMSPNILGATVSVLRCHSGIAEPVIEPVNSILSEASSDLPEISKPKRKAISYPDDFQKFYSEYPSDSGMSKTEALKAWLKLSDSDKVDAVIAIPAFKGWVSGQKKDYRTVHACRYLTQRRFDGFIDFAKSLPANIKLHPVKKDTPEWFAWLAFKKVKSHAETDLRDDDGGIIGRGWHFKTQFPPSQ